ncbi:MAG: hypothetical protein KJ067_09425 [Vicinamibacteria bacterium]|nr:hypothetical protein [Vicinamibacteria bacterium]
MKTMQAMGTGAAVALLAAATLACGGGQSSQPPATTAPAATQAAAPASAPAAGGAAEFGVAECDEYIAKYLACVDSKVPEAMRGMVRQQLDQTKAQWKQAASTPQGKEGLAMGCKAATDAARTAMQAYGCTF